MTDVVVIHDYHQVEKNHQWTEQEINYKVKK